MPVFHLDPHHCLFPPTELAEANGLLAVGGDLSTDRLLSAYRLGIFPWYSEGEPLLWWSPAPRLVIFPEEFHLPRRLARTVRSNHFQITIDHNFAAVTEACATAERGREDGTWITQDMQKAYYELHKLGYAHSIECWQDGNLAGGLYGVQIDEIFFGESMFTKARDGSKVALAALVRYCLDNTIRLIDCQMTTAHLLQFGARELSREEFEQYLQNHIHDGGDEK
jgi:leucyl/phenylalanyl-tRNA--protein transferase